MTEDIDVVTVKSAKFGVINFNGKNMWGFTLRLKPNRM